MFFARSLSYLQALALVTSLHPWAGQASCPGGSRPAYHLRVRGRCIASALCLEAVWSERLCAPEPVSTRLQLPRSRIGVLYDLSTALETEECREDGKSVAAA